MSDDYRLLPCPFCGGTNIGERHVQTYSVDSSYDVFGCEDCGAQVPDWTAEEWNRRRTTLRDELESLAERWEHAAYFTGGRFQLSELRALIRKHYPQEPQS